MKKDNKKLCYVSLTADIDPDANIALKGKEDCISAGRAGRVSVSATRRGLYILKKTIQTFSIPTTLFWEARTLNILSKTDSDLVESLAVNDFCEQGCHGLRHEDYTGKHSGIVPSYEKISSNIRKATDIISEKTTKHPVGFRAPYCNTSQNVFKALNKLEYLYDASVNTSVTSKYYRRNDPKWAKTDAIIELPVLESLDHKGKPISGYLWQMFEQRRPYTDYADMVIKISRQINQNIVQIALHPWHFAMDENGNQFSEKELENNAVSFSKLIEKLMQYSFLRFINLKDYLEIIRKEHI